MRNMKKQICRRIIGEAFFLLILCALFAGEVKAQTTSYTKAKSFLFSFREGSDMFLADYGDNAYLLERLGQRLPVYRNPLLSGTCHLLIVSHVSPYDCEEAEIINEASLRGGRIRSYLKTRLNIPNDCVAFYIDRSGNYRDRVHVYLIESPLPWFANTAIRYSESRYPVAVEAALEKYGAIPFVDMYLRGEVGGYGRDVYRIDDPLFDRSELEDYRLAFQVDTTERDRPSSTLVTTYEKTRVVRKEVPVKEMPEDNKPGEPVYQRQAVNDKEYMSAVQPGFKAVASPLHLAVKSNLLPWFGVAPSILLGAGEAKLQKGTFMLNLELECFFADRWSVAVSGMFSDFAYKNKTRDHWSVSDLSVEPRVWPLAAGEFIWLNTGLFGEYGDFDICGSEIDPDPDILYGRTGRFWTVGVSVGCVVPLGKGFCLEGSVRTGYRSVFDGKKYRYDKIDDKNYLESRFLSTGFMVGAKISVVYRFQIR